MDWPPPPKSWGEFLPECFWYLMPGLVVHFVFLLVSLVLVWSLSFSKLKVPQFRSVVLFHGFLLVFAMIANGFWSCSVWGNLYWSVDYVSDFSAFYPITPGRIDFSWSEEITGGLGEITLSQLNLIWLGFVLLVWSAALIATLAVLQKTSKGGQMRPC